MRELITAGEVRAGDTVPLVGRVVETKQEGDIVLICTTFSGFVDHKLGADQLLWIDREPSRAGWPNL